MESLETSSVTLQAQFQEQIQSSKYIYIARDISSCKGIESVLNDSSLLSFDTSFPLVNG